MRSEFPVNGRHFLLGEERICLHTRAQGIYEHASCNMHALDAHSAHLGEDLAPTKFSHTQRRRVGRFYDAMPLPVDHLAFLLRESTPKNEHCWRGTCIQDLDH